VSAPLPRHARGRGSLDSPPATARERPTTGDRTLLISIDFEDWRQLVRRQAGASGWDVPTPAFERQVEAVLAFLDEVGAKATFFLLGMTARNYPHLVEKVLAAGHEPASHGFWHNRVFRQTPDEFRSDVEESIALIKELTGRAPRGYRAPAFSVNRETVWAYRILHELGFEWDSSQYDSPKIPRRLGPIPPSPYTLALPGGGELVELPLTVLPVAGGRSVPIGGGSYWRVLPAAFLERALGRCEMPAVLYFHPYEFDPYRLDAELPAGSPAGQRARAAVRSLRASPGRARLRARLRRIVSELEPTSYEQEIAKVRSRNGERPRALSEEGDIL
jgi:polysaccharide deacetylase family protein (PEP-CTERM system associated)